MARIKGLDWKRAALGRDLHVLPGHSTRALVGDLEVQLTKPTMPVGFDDTVDLAAYRATHAGTTFEFRPLFRATPNGDLWEGTGLGYTISVHRATGVVKVGSTVPPVGTPAKRNFIVEAILKGPEGEARQVIRFQIHQSVIKAWLTPGTLTMRRDSTVTVSTAGVRSGVRFTVRAEFDDGIVGDVTVNHGVTWSSSPAGRVGTDGLLQPGATDGPGSTITITATLPATLGGQAASTGTLTIAPALSGTTIEAQAITGGAAAVYRKPEDSPNVLFVSCGFDQQSTFTAITDLIVDSLRTNQLTRPFDLLASSINFWRVYLPGTAPAISIREEMYAPPGSSGAYLAPMPPALPPPASGPWTDVSHLLYAAGLPTPADASKSVATLRTEWGALVHADHAASIASTTIVPNPLIEAWLPLTTRGMVDEVDTVPAVAMGGPPAAGLTGSAMLSAHDDRGGTPYLRALVGHVTAPAGITVPQAARLGDLWIRDHNAWRFSNGELVVLLSSYPGGRPLNMHPPISIGTVPQRDAFPVAAVAGRKAWTLVPVATPGVASHMVRVFAHELAHSFGLGDEYREFKAKDPQPDDRALDWYSNLQYVTAVDGGSGLQGSRIKWNWHRIRKAAVVSGPIPPSSTGVFRVPVADTGGVIFAPGDKVLLRTRSWKAVIGHPPPTVLNPAAHEAVVVAPIENDAVNVTAGPTTSLTHAAFDPFKPGSLIYVPTPAPASVFHAVQYPYAEIIAKNIRDHIDAQHKPMTAVPCVPEAGQPSITQPLLPGVTLRSDFCGLCSPWIVGLYEGGNRYACGVFRPAGECNMGPAKPFEHKAFCPVCRYVLVDAIDPIQHGALDRAYELVYPL